MSTIVLIGSSIFEEWKSADRAMPEDTVVNRAVGGTVTTYWKEYLDPVLLDVRPDDLWFYCGSNDLNNGVGEKDIIAHTLACRALLHARLRAATFVYFGIIKAPQKAGKWDRIDHINSTVKRSLLVGDRYIETNDVFWQDGQPVEDYFREDALHITEAGYEALTEYVKHTLHACERV